MKTKAIATGERWEHISDCSVWKVVCVSVSHVGLSGPYPCRSYQEVDLDEFLSNFYKVVS